MMSRSNLIFSGCKGKPSLLNQRQRMIMQDDITRPTYFGNRGSTKPILMRKFSTRCQKVALKAIAKPTSTMNLFKRTNMNKEKQVEKATFCALVFACTGGAGPSASKALKQVASKLSARKEDKNQLLSPEEVFPLYSWVKDA